MDGFGNFLGGLIVFALIVLFILLCASDYQDFHSQNDYEYVDLDGNTGLADYCDNATSSGGLQCRIGDRTILVKEYTKIKKED